MRGTEYMYDAGDSEDMDRSEEMEEPDYMGRRDEEDTDGAHYECDLNDIHHADEVDASHYLNRENDPHDLGDPHEMSDMGDMGGAGPWDEWKNMSDARDSFRRRENHPYDQDDRRIYPVYGNNYHRVHVSDHGQAFMGDAIDQSQYEIHEDNRDYSTTRRTTHSTHHNNQQPHYHSTHTTQTFQESHEGSTRTTQHSQQSQNSTTNQSLLVGLAAVALTATGWGLAYWNKPDRPVTGSTTANGTVFNEFGSRPGVPPAVRSRAERASTAPQRSASVALQLPASARALQSPVPSTAREPPALRNTDISRLAQQLRNIERHI
jgi:hypothetical protein